MARNSVFRAYLLGLAVWLLAFVLALMLGVTDNADWNIISQLRLPRALIATGIGMGLAVAGAALQALFSNPLCEPYTLGVSSGSALGAVIGVSLGWEASFLGLTTPSFVGALAFTGVLYLISIRPGVGNLVLLLAGVMLSFLGSSLVSLWMALADPNGVQSAVFWLLGDLSRARLGGSVLTMMTVSLFSFAIWRRWRQLDALLMGEEGALALGVDVAGVRRTLILLTSFLIGVCVSGGGMIGFVGLVIPHFARRLVGSLHFSLIPLCAIWGAAALTLADTLARVALRPYELPVGVVTSLIGVPIFLWVVLKRRQFT